MTEERKYPYCPGDKYPGGCLLCAEFHEEHKVLIERVKELESLIDRYKSLPKIGWGKRAVEEQKRADAAEDQVAALESELAQAKAAAVQWVTHDGTPETRPGIGMTVLLDAGEDGTIVVYYRSHPVEGRTWCHYELGAGDFEVEVGDRWAYLPTPGNEG